MRRQGEHFWESQGRRHPHNYLLLSRMSFLCLRTKTRKPELKLTDTLLMDWEEAASIWKTSLYIKHNFGQETQTELQNLFCFGKENTYEHNFCGRHLYYQDPHFLNNLTIYKRISKELVCPSDPSLHFKRQRK